MKRGQVKRRMMKKVGDVVGKMLAKKEEQKVNEPIEVITKSKFCQLLEFYTKGMKKEENVKEKERECNEQEGKDCYEEGDNKDEDEFDLELEKENKNDDNENNVNNVNDDEKIK